MRIIHYLNQFFGQIGAESAADCPLEIREGTVGPGKVLNNMIGDQAEIVATIICGDNYFAENTEEVSPIIEGYLREYKADLVVAGPAFTAGRYGMACGNVCKIAHQQLHIPAVSGMYEENPGLEMYRKYAYIVPTANNARGMKDALTKITALVRKMANGETLGSPEEEGYYARGVRLPYFREKNGGQRAVEMLLKKMKGEPFETELEMPKFTKFKPSKAISDISKAKICIMTSGGIVPAGNPDGMEACFCTKYNFYPFEAYGGTDIPESEVAHGGYDPTYANADGNRVLPSDAIHELQAEGLLGEVYPYAGVTVGNAMAVDQATTIGNAFAKQLLEDHVDGVILTST